MGTKKEMLLLLGNITRIVRDIATCCVLGIRACLLLKWHKGGIFLPCPSLHGDPGHYQPRSQEEEEEHAKIHLKRLE